MDARPTRGAARFDAGAYLVERGASADIFLAAALGLTDTARAMLEANPVLLELRTGQGDYGEKPPSSFHIYLWTIGASRSPLDVAAQFEQRKRSMLMLAFARRSRLLLACHQGDEASARAVLRDDPTLMTRLTADDRRAITDAAWHAEPGAVAVMSNTWYLHVLTTSVDTYCSQYQINVVGIILKVLKCR